MGPTFFVQGSNEWPGTAHVTLGQMRGLKKTAPYVTNIQTFRHPDAHGNSITESAQWGRFSEKCGGKQTDRSYENTEIATSQLVKRPVE